MKPPLKLNAIDQEHLQELYDSLGTARDELPYTPKFDELVQGFQDRTFKNADHEQVFAALLKYVRSSSNASSEQQAVRVVRKHVAEDLVGAQAGADVAEHARQEAVGVGQRRLPVGARPGYVPGLPVGQSA